MKAKKIFGMVACASACVALPAFGNDNLWFGVSASGSTVTTNNCIALIDGVFATATDGAIVLDNDKGTPLSIDPSAAAISDAATKGDGVVKVTGTAVLTPSMVSDFDVSDTGAKAGFAVGIDNNNVTNFYGFANGVWTKLTGTPTDGATTFMLLLDYRGPSVSFYVNDTLLAAADGGATSFALASGTTALGGISAFGSGSISSISSRYEVAVAAVVVNETTVRYGSIAEAIAAAGNNQANIAVVNEDGTTGTANEQAANGLPKWECEALNIAEDATIPLVPSTKQNANKITLALNTDPSDGVTVKFRVSTNGVVAEDAYDKDNIQIPMTTGQHTIVPAVSATAN